MIEVHLFYIIWRFIFIGEIVMYVRTLKNKKGETRFEISEKYKHPLTGKWKTVTESFYQDTARERKMAERRLLSKIAKILDDLERTYNPEK